MFTERVQRLELVGQCRNSSSILSFSAFWLLLLEEKAVQPGAQKSELGDCFPRLAFPNNKGTPDGRPCRPAQAMSAPATL
jgi:hypothetical protein